MIDHNLGRVAALIALATIALTSCGGNSSPTGTGAGDDPILTISNDWKEEGNPDHHFSFASADDGKRAGIFTGEEFVADSTNTLVGSWSSGNVDFTVSRAQLASYSGRFSGDNPKRLVLQSGSTTLVLVQGAVAR